MKPCFKAKIDINYFHDGCLHVVIYILLLYLSHLVYSLLPLLVDCPVKHLFCLDLDLLTSTGPIDKEEDGK